MIGDLVKKINHFADDSIGCLRDEHQIPRFNAHIKTFCDATGMAENMSKREVLPIGSLRDKPHSSFAGIRQEWSQTKGRMVNKGWVEMGEYLISLGYPLGNDFDTSTFLYGRYRAAKAKLASVALVSRIGIVGRHRILNANYYGMMRYYLWALTFGRSFATTVYWSERRVRNLIYRK